MRDGNMTLSETFLIVGFSDYPQLQAFLFIVFLLIYLITLLGNILIVVIIYSTSNMHTPMYFFLTNLSFIDISYTSVIFPQLLAHFFQEGTHVSLNECLSQVYFFAIMLSAELILLTVMAYDRYVAICHPLRYITIMNRTVCLWLAAGSWALGLMIPLPHTLLMSGLIYCHSHEINHFFCDFTALMELSCTSTQAIEITGYILSSTFGLVPFFFIITSYVKIISAILRIQSTEGRHKTFSTCASHLIVVILFYGSVCSTYIRPTATHSMKDNKILSLSYTTVTPLCNPIIYSLKNTEFKIALKKRRNV